MSNSSKLSVTVPPDAGTMSHEQSMLCRYAPDEPSVSVPEEVVNVVEPEHTAIHFFTGVGTSKMTIDRHALYQQL